MANTTDAMKSAAESLVERARLGDQNAMATITSIAEAKAKGSQRANMAHALILDYIHKHPSPGHGFVARRKPTTRFNVYHLLREASKEPDLAQFAGDVGELVLKAPDAMAAAVSIADGCPLTRDRLEAIAKLLGDEKEQRLFMYCLACSNGAKMRILVQVLPPNGRQIAKAGSALGMARKIQGIRSGRMPLARLSPMVAWELGE